ncbi:MAG: LarC family nickel insertion protein [Desulfobacterales bacterium]|nr:LarC family nickel insertion protein [Desulfobacterales bacterium]
MKIAYFDCFAGASGDMILGALLDAGLALDRLRDALGRLHLEHHTLDVRPAVKQGLGGSQALVRIDRSGQQPHRGLREIGTIIAASGLEDIVKDRSLAIFQRLAQAEAAVHRVPLESVHFHEVGALDAIVDIVGAVAGLHLLEIQKVFCSPLHLGTGTVTSAHGTLPVPAPATLELVRGRPVYSSGVAGELLTPTGAAILTTLAEGFGPMPAMVPTAVGYGAGNLEREIPNLLRLIIGDSWSSRPGPTVFSEPS